MYGSETWPMKVEDKQKLERAENAMVRWMCGVTIKDRISTAKLRERLGICSVTNFCEEVDWDSLVMLSKNLMMIG